MKHMFSVHSLFSNKTFFHERTFRTKSNIRFILASIFHQSSWLFRHLLSHRFVHWFFMDNCSKMDGRGAGRHPLFPTFSETLPFHVDVYRNLSQFGALLLPFWRPLAQCWLPLTPFWRPLVHFWCPWGNFWSPLDSIFSLLESPGVIFHIWSYFLWRSHVKSSFLENDNWKPCVLNCNHIVWNSATLCCIPSFKGSAGRAEPSKLDSRLIKYFAQKAPAGIFNDPFY